MLAAAVSERVISFCPLRRTAGNHPYSWQPCLTRLPAALHAGFFAALKLTCCLLMSLRSTDRRLQVNIMIEHWSCEQVCDWLLDNSFSSALVANFREQGVDGSLLVQVCSLRLHEGPTSGGVGGFRARCALRALGLRAHMVAYAPQVDG